MANKDSNKGENDVFAEAAIYKIKRDALMIVSNMNRGGSPASPDKMKRQIVFIQGQLCAAAVADPGLSPAVKDRVVSFHSQTILENIDDRRGARRRRKQR